MGHAGAIISGGKGTAEAKVAAFAAGRRAGGRPAGPDPGAAQGAPVGSVGRACVFEEQPRLPGRAVPGLAGESRGRWSPRLGRLAGRDGAGGGPPAPSRAAGTPHAGAAAAAGAESGRPPTRPTAGRSSRAGSTACSWAYREVGYFYARLNPLLPGAEPAANYLYPRAKGAYEQLSLEEFGLSASRPGHGVLTRPATCSPRGPPCGRSCSGPARPTARAWASSSCTSRTGPSATGCCGGWRPRATAPRCRRASGAACWRT